MESDIILKRIKKKEKVYFYIMIMLSILIPSLAFLADLKGKFILWYIIIFEILILMAILARINILTLKFKYYNDRLKIRYGLLLKESMILCDNVSLVHTCNQKEDLEIIIISNSKFRNKRFKPVVNGLLKKYPEIKKDYERLKRNNPSQVYYFQIIKNGNLRKYILLEKIYTTCVKAVYTSSAIENIKIARGLINFEERG